MYAQKKVQLSSFATALWIALQYEQAYRESLQGGRHQEPGPTKTDSELQAHLIRRPANFHGQPPVHGNPPQPPSEEAIQHDSHDAPPHGESLGDGDSHGTGESDHGRHRRHDHDGHQVN